MSNLHLVTGYAGQAHVTASDDGSFNTAIFGSGQYVLDIGSKFAASVVSNNKITIADGDLLMQGRHVRLNEGTTVDLTITNGTQGKLRNDLIVARYTKDSVSGVEQVNLVVIQGTAVDSDPVDPAYTSGDIINDHVLLNDMPLYRVPLNGLTVGTPVALFSVQSGANALNINDLGAVSIVKLWENESPSSSFAAQTIPLDLSGYSLVFVALSMRTTYPGTLITAVGHVDEGSVNPYYYSEQSLYRYFRAKSDGIEFGVGYQNNTTSNNIFIPRYIYGFKGGV